LADDYERARKWVEDNAPLTWREFVDAFPRNYATAKGGYFLGGRFHERELVKAGFVEGPHASGVSREESGERRNIFFGVEAVAKGEAVSVTFNGLTVFRDSRGQVHKRREGGNGRFIAFTTEERTAMGRAKKK
jgi:hypothetical protein